MLDVAMQSIAMFIFIFLSIEVIIPSQTARLYRLASGRNFNPPYLKHSIREFIQKIPAYLLIGWLCFEASKNIDKYIAPLSLVIILMLAVNVGFRVIKPMFSDIRSNVP